MARRGIDIGQFLSPFRGDISGQALAAGTFNDIGRQMQSLRGQFQDDQQTAAALAEKAREFGITTEEDARQFDDALQGTNMRHQSGLDADRAKFDFEQDVAQRGRESLLVGEGVEAFRRGDLNALEGVKTRAGIAAPKLQFTLPGEAPAATLSPMTGLLDSAAVFQPRNGLGIARGTESLYSGDAEKVRQREKDIAGRALAPMQGGMEGQYMMPALSAGVGAAGDGLTGADAVKMAIASADKAAARGTSRENARMISSQKSDATGFQQDNKLHDQVEDIAGRIRADYKVKDVVDKQTNLEAFTRDVETGVPLAQNLAKAFLMKDAIKGAASDKDASRFEGAAGFWNKLENQYNAYMKGGELSPGFAEQLKFAVGQMKLSADLKRTRAATAARDIVYSSRFLPFPDDVATVRGAMQAFSAVSGEPYTEEEFAQEFQRYQTIKHGPAGRAGGGGGQSSGQRVQMRGDIVPGPAGAPPLPLGPMGGLGVAPVDGRPPRPPRASAPQQVQQPDWDAEADALLGGQ